MKRSWRMGRPASMEVGADSGMVIFLGEFAPVGKRGVAPWTAKP